MSDAQNAVKFMVEQVLAGKVGAVRSLRRCPSVSNEVYDVDGRYMVKFLKDMDRLESFKKQAELLAVIGEFVSFELPKVQIREVQVSKEYAHIVPTVSDGKTVAAFYPKSRGTVINERRFLSLPGEFQEQILDDHALFAAQMHTIPLGRVNGLIDDIFLENLNAVIDRTLPALNTYEPSFKARLKGEVLTRAGRLCNLVVCYDDHHLRNSLVNDAQNKVTGFLDFECVNVHRFGTLKGPIMSSKKHTTIFMEKYQAYAAPHLSAVPLDGKRILSVHRVVENLSRAVFGKMNGR